MPVRKDNILLMDGVRYELWTPPSEDEFEQVVKEHVQEIFGDQCVYIDRKKKLKSLSGIGSIPDGYAIVLGDKPEWHIVEMELSSHQLHEHIVAQVSRFINGVKNPSTQRDIARALYNEVIDDNFLKLKLEQATESSETYKFLSDLVAELPVLTIVIEKDTRELREAISTLAHPQIEVVEFQTFVREGVGLPVHAHLFEPLHGSYATKGRSVTALASASVAPLESPAVKGEVETRTLRQNVEFEIIASAFKSKSLRIWKRDRYLFPDCGKIVTLVTDTGEIESVIRKERVGGIYLDKGLSDWYYRNPHLKPGDRVRLTVIEPMKKYRLEVLKQQASS